MGFPHHDHGKHVTINDWLVWNPWKGEEEIPVLAWRLAHESYVGTGVSASQKKQSWKLTEEKGGHVVGLLVANVFLVECLWLCVTFCTLNSCHFLYANFVGHYRRGIMLYTPRMFIILVGESKKSKKLRELLWLGVYPYWFAIIILEIFEDNSPKIGCRARWDH